MLTFNEINLLGQILSDTSAPGQGNIARINSHLQDNNLVLTYSTIVNFAGETALRLQTDRLAHESNSVLKKRITEIKNQFSKAADEALVLKEQENQDSIELIQATSNSPYKVAYYRRFVTLKIEN